MKLRKIIALLLALALVVGMTACGSKSDSAANGTAGTGGTGTGTGTGNGKVLAEELGYGYLSEYKSLELETDYISNSCSAAGKLYLMGSHYDDTTGQEQYLIYEIDPATGSTASLGTPSMTSTENSSEYIMYFTMSPDANSYWLVKNSYTWTNTYEDVELYEDDVLYGDAPVATEDEIEYVDPVYIDGEEGAEQADGELETEPVSITDADSETAAEEGGNLTDDVVAVDGGSTEVYSLLHCDRDGNILETIVLPDTLSENGYFYPSGFASDAEGNLYIAADALLVKYTAATAAFDRISLDVPYISDLAATEDGHVVLHYYTEDTWKDVYAPIENGTLGEPYSIDESISGGRLYSATGSGLLLNDGTKLYRLDTAAGTVTPLLNWLDSDISGSSVSAVAASDDNTLLVLLQDYSSDTINCELGVLTKTPYDQIPARTVLTLGAVYIDSMVESSIVRFNRNSDTYRISVVDYSGYNTDDDYTAGAKQLELDIISGAGPDIISLSDVNTTKLMSKGALTDLSGYINNDPELAGDKLMAAPMKAYSSDGKIYGIPEYFYVQTLLGSARHLGDRTGWTAAEMAQVVGGLDSETQIIDYYTRSELLNNLVNINLSSYVDYAKATCSFDTDEFRSLLQLCMKLPEEYNYDEDVYYSDSNQKVQSGETLLVTLGLGGSYEVRNLLGLYTYENGFVNIGYPTESGNGAVLNVYSGLSISSTCADPDGAWSFIKASFADHSQSSMWYGFPVLTSAFDAMLEEAAKQDSYENEDGTITYMESYGYIGDTEYTIGLPTEAQLQSFKDYVNNAAVSSGRYDNDILSIIQEEAAAFFNGDKSAEEVSSLIQSRVSIYLGETS